MLSKLFPFSPLGSDGMNPQFDTVFADYLSQIKQAPGQNQRHDFRRQLFLSFLQKAFDIDLSDIEIERYIQIANQQVPVKGIARVRKGWVVGDAE